MPETVTSPSSAHAVTTPSMQKPRSQPAARKKRIMRRRGKAKDGIESDDEIVREVGTDSEPDEDDQSSSGDSATEDSDTEPVSDDVPSHLQSPSSGEVVGVEDVPRINGAVAPFFGSTSTWSDMVAAEGSGGGDLPVIEFAEFTATAKIPARPSKKAQKQRKKAAVAAAQTGSDHEEQEPEETKPSAPQEKQTSSLPPRRPGQTARQAYQQRLESDPSYVPKVGGFWGHDDRLMDKDLRSLSGWWRVRWQDRGRGRGFGVRSRPHAENETAKTDADLPPVERPWTHDGFEEMKRKEEERKARQESNTQAQRGRGGFHGGRGGFAGRGRGTFRPHLGTSPASSARGGASPVPVTPAGRPDRVWYAKKPESAWSKQHEGFLFKGGRNNHSSGYRVKLPGSATKIAKADGPYQSSTQPPTSKASVPQSEKSENKETPTQNQYMVRLPKQKQQKKKSASTQKPPVEPSLSPDAATITQPRLIIPGLAESTASTATPEAPLDSGKSAQPPTADVVLPDQTLPSPSVVSQLEQLSIEVQPSDPERQAKMAEAVLKNPPSETPVEQTSPSAPSEQRPILPPLQTVFTPPPPLPPPAQPSPQYGSPYAYNHALPGMAYNPGIVYQHPVYLQAPPPGMYNPRPLMHSHLPPYGHMHHPSMSPDFLSQPPSHTPPINTFIDPATGAPLFVFPRSNARIEIRAPSGEVAQVPSANPTANGKSTNGVRGGSKLRTSASSFEPARPVNGEAREQWYPSLSDGPPSYETTNGTADDGSQQQGGMGMMGYPPYQQGYYYGYPGYMDAAQVGQYDAYNGDQRQQAGAYY